MRLESLQGWDAEASMLRLFAMRWSGSDGRVRQITLALRPNLFRVARRPDGRSATVLGLRVSFRRLDR